MSETIARTSGSIRFASSTVKCRAVVGEALMIGDLRFASMAIGKSIRPPSITAQQVYFSANSKGLGSPFTHTGSYNTFDSATAVGLSVD